MVLDKVKNTIKKYNLINKNDKLVIGVSGGPDSLALLYVLNSLKKSLKINLHIAHLDHMLRKDSYKDKEFVEDLAKRLDIAITTAQIDIKNLAKVGSLEEIARNARLGFLFKVARDVRAKKIALGHNRDDQAETVLMRVLRGTGLYGLSGILPKRNISGFIIIRPLIEVSRKEIENYLKNKKIKPRQDYTNLKDIYFRNRIRNRLLPLLKREYNPNIKEVLANMAEGLGTDYLHLLKMSQKAFLKNSKIINKNKINLYLNRFLKLDPAIQRMVLRLGIAKIKGNLRRISFKHIREIEDLIYNRPFNSIVDLPQGICIIKKKKYISICLRDKQ
jgi:tRNA(Ile)-lysidine synthase